MTTALTEAERLAAQWHDTHYDEDDHSYSSCWCCCITCEHTNPHYDAAKAAVRTEPVIVGIESHRFQGDGPACVGVLGYAPSEERHGEVCGVPADAPIHTVTAEPFPSAFTVNDRTGLPIVTARLNRERPKR